MLANKHGVILPSDIQEAVNQLEVIRNCPIIEMAQLAESIILILKRMEA